MKSWTDRQVFFVFDTEYCQNEADDPKDAIVYFYPHETSDNVRCTLCCQLMGMCRFIKSCFSPVSLIRLDKGKFAIRSLEKFTLALKGNPDMPDSVLQRQLSSLIRLFSFYYKDFSTVWNFVHGNRAEFIMYMTSEWSQLLSITQHGGDTLSLTFDVIPSIDLPKTAGLLFLQTLQLLQACQRFSGVYAGCLFCDRRVIFSQLSTGILGKLSFIWQKHKIPGEHANVHFELPGGITLITVYLTQAELHDLQLIKLDGDLSSQKTSEEFGQPVNSLNPEPSPTNISPLESDVTSSSSLSETTLTRSGESVTVSCTDDSYRYPSIDTPLTDATDHSEISADDTRIELMQLQPRVLYVQEYNDTILILLLDMSCKDSQRTIYELWKLCMSTMMALETDVKVCLDNSPKKETETELKYLYLQFDKIRLKTQGNVLSSKAGGVHHQVFNRSAQLLHEDFIREPQLYETTIRTQDLAVYSHVLGSRETYFYSHSPKQSTNSPGSKQSSAGFPTQPDQTAFISTKAKKKLLKEQRLVLL